MLLERGQILQNRYEIIEKIGSGGMAVVYKAVDGKLARKVAIKVLREEFEEDEEFIARFKNEAQAAARLSHPNIVNVYDVEHYDGIHFIVMELIEGKTLKELIDEKAPFDETSALSVAHQIASALYIAHSHGIIHRDIKPQNIIVVRDGSVKVADFGIARAATTKTISSKAGAIGSVHYFAPEQAKGGYIDDKSDIYSLGIVMYEMLSGVLPYDGESSVEVALKHINEEMRPLCEIDSSLSESVQAIVSKATQKRRDMRYSSIEEMMVDLKKALTDKSGYFVVKKKLDESETITFSDEEVQQIRTESKKSAWDDYAETNSFGSYSFDNKPAHTAYKGGKKVFFGGLSQTSKVIIAAAVTALIIIIALSFWFSRMFFDKEPSAEKIVMPDFLGESFEIAEANAESLGIVLEKNELNDDTVPEGKIISQGVEEGTEIFAGDIVGVTVSTGPVLVKLPNVEKSDESKAYEELMELPVNILETVYEHSDNVAFGIVMRQIPSAGTEVKAESDVQLFVSKGPEPKEVVVKNVVGKTESEAIQILENDNFVVSISRSTSETVASGVVMSQSREAGRAYREGSIVDIIVSTGKPEPEPTQNEEPDSSAQTSKTLTYEITSGSIPEGTESVHVRMTVIDTATGSTSVPFDEMVNVNDFPFYVPVTGSGYCEVTVYIDNGMEWQERVNFDE